MKVSLWQRVRIALRSEEWAINALTELPIFCEFWPDQCGKLSATIQPSRAQFIENGTHTENCVEREVVVTAGCEGRLARRGYDYPHSEHKRFAAHIVGS